MVEPYTLVFKPCMGVETNVLQQNLTMEKWVFGFDIAYQLVPLMHLGFRGSPSLGLGSRWTCHFTWLFGVWYWLYTGKMEAASRLRRYASIGFHVCDSFLFCGSFRCHTSHPGFAWMFAGAKGWRREAWIKLCHWFECGAKV